MAPEHNPGATNLGPLETWREALWLAHGCIGPHEEMRCAACGVDFKRDSAEAIVRAFARRVAAQLEYRERVAQTIAWVRKDWAHVEAARQALDELRELLDRQKSDEPNNPSGRTGRPEHT